MVGGSCYHDRMSTWRDTMISVGGPLPPAVASEFERAWRAAHGGRTGGPESQDADAPPVSGWTYALSGPQVRPQCDLRGALPALIAGAARSAHLTTPYLVPSRRSGTP